MPCPVPLEPVDPAGGAVGGKTIEVLVDGQQRIKFEDAEHPLPAGQIGLRTWQRGASFRNLRIQAGGQTTPISLRAASANADQVSGMWRPVHRGDRQRAPCGALHSSTVRRPAMPATSLAATDEIGVENQGLNR